MRLNEDGVPELYFCNNLTCEWYGEIQAMYVGYFAIDAVFFSAVSGLFGFLFALRRHTKTKSIV